MEKLYGRLLIISQNRDIILENMLSYKLAPFLLHCLMTIVDSGKEPSLSLFTNLMFIQR